MRRLRSVLVLALVLSVLTSACASSKPFVVTGESLNQAGQLFVATGHAYNEALDTKAITVEQYRPWAAFALKFKQAFPLAVQGWHSARLANDKVMEKKSSDAVAVLTSQLAKFGLDIYNLVVAKGGK